MAPPQGAKGITMAHRAPKIIDTVKFTDQQQAILNDAVEQLMEAGGLTALSCRRTHRHMPEEVLVHQLKVLPPASSSLRLAAHTLPLTMRLPLPAPRGTFTR